MSRRLKKSLSQVLTKFYPLAGRFDSLNHSIDCNDEGLEYIEARVQAPLTLSQVLACPKPEELDGLQPCDAYNYGTGFKGLSAVQVNVFDKCGSMAIGVSLSHMLMDASSLAFFIDTWAAIARGEDKDTSVAAIFNSASLFPPRDHIPAQKYDHTEGEVARNFTVKRFVFPQYKIESLRAKFAYQRPTRVEVVSALLLKCMINACKKTSSESILPGITINLRTRVSPPLPMHYCGNMALSIVTKKVESGSVSLNGLGMQLRGLIQEIDGDYFQKLQADNASLLYDFLEDQTKSFGDSRVIGVSSLCKFSFYHADVGWGVPTWLASVHPTWENCVVLMDGKNGNGIEAWATLDKDDMTLLESDKELLEFASPDPIMLPNKL